MAVITLRTTSNNILLRYLLDTNKKKILLILSADPQSLFSLMLSVRPHFSKSRKTNFLAKLWVWPSGSLITPDLLCCVSVPQIVMCSRDYFLSPSMGACSFEIMQSARGNVKFSNQGINVAEESQFNKTKTFIMN